MRNFALFLLISSAIGVAAAADVWRWKDANGVVHYSDQPVPGAERLSVSPAPKPGSVATPPPPPRAAAAAAAEPETPRIVPYQRCALSEPILPAASTLRLPFSPRSGSTVEAAAMVAPRSSSITWA